MDWLIPQTINGLTLGGVYALIALGYSLVYGVLRLINFAHGDVYMVAAVTAYGVAVGLNWQKTADDPVTIWTVVLMLATAMLACMVVGYVIERFAYRPLRRAPRLNSLITAIGVSFLLENIFQLPLVFGPNPGGFPAIAWSTPHVSLGGYTIRYEQILILTGTAVFLIACRHIILHTRMGLAIRAASFHHDHARLMGINVDRVISFTFILGSSLAACAGVFVGLYQRQIDALMGVNAGLKAFTAAVFGGIGSLSGAVLGGLLMGLSETYIAGSAFSNFRDAFAFLLLIVILLVRPSGLLGKVATEKV